MRPHELSDGARKLLGLRPMKTIRARFLEAVKANPEAGVSPREMHRRNPEVDLLDWMAAGYTLHNDKKLRHEWSPLKNNVSAAQESRYFLPKDEETK